MGRSLLGGKLVATAVSNIDGRHITVRLSPKRPPQGNEKRWQACSLEEAVRCFVDVPLPDLRAGDSVGSFDIKTSTLWANGSDQRRINATLYVLLCAAGRLEGSRVLQSSACFYCGRPLTDPVSIRRGIGPVCFGKVTGSKHERKNIDDFPPQVLAGPPAPTPPAPQPTTNGQAVLTGTHGKEFAGNFVTLAPGQDPRELLQ